MFCTPRHVTFYFWLVDGGAVWNSMHCCKEKKKKKLRIRNERKLGKLHLFSYYILFPSCKIFRLHQASVSDNHITKDVLLTFCL